MASVAFGLVGAALAPAGFAGLGYTLFSGIGSYLFPPSLPDVHNEGSRRGDVPIQSSAYGNMIPRIWGIAPPPTNIIWSKPVREVINTSTQEQGGKGSPSQTVTSTTYQYFLTFAVALCEGPIAGVSRIWMNGELVFDQLATSSIGTVIISNERWNTKLRIYLGTETQEVDPAIEAHEGVGESSAYRGTAYIVFEDLDITNLQTVPLIKAEVVRHGASGTQIEYFDLDLATELSSAENATTYVSSMQEVWTIDSAYNSPTGPARIAVRNLSTNTTSYIDYPAEYPVHTSGPYKSIVYVPERNRVLVAARAVTGNLPRTYLVYDASTKAYIGAWHDRTMNTWGSSPLGVNTETDQCLISDENGGLQIWSIDSDCMPVSLLDSIATDGAGPYGGSYALNDDDENFWFLISGAFVDGPAWVRHSTLGQDVYPLDADSGHFNDADQQCKDTSRNCFYYWSATGNRLKKFDPDTQTITNVNSTAYSSSVIGSKIEYEPISDRIYALSGGSSGPFALYVINPSDGSIETYSIPDDGGFHFASQFGFAQGVIWSASSPESGNIGIGQLRLNSLTASAPTVSEFIEEVCGFVDIAPESLNLAATDGFTLPSYGVYSLSSAREAIEPVGQRYCVDFVESDLKIKAVVRGGAPAVSLTSADLGVFTGGGDAAKRLSVSRTQPLELWRELRVGYVDRTANWAKGMQYARRISSESRKIQEINTTLGLTADEAIQMARKALSSQHAGKLVLKGTTSIKYAWLEPTDIFSINHENVDYNVMATDKKEVNLITEWVWRTDDPNVYTQTASGAALPVATSLVSAIGGNRLILVDGPVLREEDLYNSGVYGAAAGFLEGFRGSELHKSFDFTNYSSTGVLLGPDSSVGSVAGTLGDFFGGNMFDEMNEMVVTLYPGCADLASSSGFEATLLGDCHAFVGAPGRWEIVGWVDATLVAPKTYRIRRLLRGRAGTEQYMGTHQPGDLFVAIRPGAITRVAVPTSDATAERKYKSVTFGQTVPQTPATSFTFQNEGAKPLSPAVAIGTRDTSGNLHVDFIRRVRAASLVWGDSDLPLNETLEKYNVEIWDSTYTTLKRTISDLASEEFDYSSADQTTDFGSNQNPVYVKIRQHGTYGLGHPLVIAV